MFAKRIILAIALAGFAAGAIQGQQRPQRSGSDPGSEKEEPTVVKPGSAWTLTYPLGDHVESTLDTLTYNFQRRYIPSMVTDAYATTGNQGAPGIDMLYLQRPDPSVFFFEDALRHWLHSFSTQKFYNVYIPTTVLSYGFGGNKLNHMDRLQTDFAGNVNRRIGIGAMLDYQYSKGAYENQAAKDFIFGLSGYYRGERYEMQAFFNHFNSLNKENGGITDPLYITDPAELQGGVNKIEPKSIPTRLSGTHNRLNGAQVFMTHAYKVGFWKEEVVNDTLTRDVYVPVTRFIYSFDYNTRKHTFINTNTTQGQEFWANHYLNPQGSHESTYYWDLTNSFGVEMMEGFNKWVPFGLSAYVSYRYRKFKQVTAYPPYELTDDDRAGLTPMPEGIYVAPTTGQSLLWVGGRLQKDMGTTIRYEANVKFGLSGDVVGDLDLDGRITTRFRMLGDTVGISAYGSFRNLEPSYLLQHYVSNHFVWDNDFGKTRRLRFGGELTIPWTRTTLSAGAENVQNLVYFNPQSLPTQHGGSVQIFSATLEQKLRFGVWNWNNRITYQTSSDQDVLPMPKLAIYSNMYIGARLFRVLDIQLGVDCDYYTRYTGYCYQPALMAFRVQGGDDKVKVGNYPLCNAYFTAKLYKVRFFVLWSHLNQGWFSKDYFSMPDYPINPRQLQFGLSIDFAD